MSIKVLIRNRAARVFIFSGRTPGGVIKKITLRPLADNNQFHKVDKADWDLVKDQPAVKALIKKGDIHVQNQLDEGETSVDAQVDTKKLSGDTLVKAGDVENAKAKAEAEIAKMKADAEAEIAEMKAAADVEIAAKLEAADTRDTEADDAKVEPQNLDELLERLETDGKTAAKDMKPVLVAYAVSKYNVDLKRLGVSEIITKLKELETEAEAKADADADTE